ncbi:hypothetical protein [Caenibius sp. WL]|uniref:hypothetical protein n=1 Tax=Caenibius sp. WL TaxID=2872646 RepID=UPI001C994169|nr:hypothetical protein [Caenibius sp. WL]QZP06841.1 hypothetical protein K5X80_08875 [Caenibius sp. WL]
MTDKPVLDTIVIEKTKTYQQTRAQLGRIGPIVMETPRGPVEVEDAPGFLTMQVDREGAPHSIAVLVYEPRPGKGRGLVVQMDANSARAVAASLMMMADRLEAVDLDS